MSQRDRHSLRAQADKQEYSRQMRKTMENTEHLTIRQAEVSELIVEDGQIKGVKTFSGAIYHAKAVVLCTGTYLRARCIYGDVSNPTGPNGLQAATHLTDSLIANGIVLKQEHRQELTREASTFQRWRSSLEIREWFRFLSLQTRKAFRKSRLPAG